MMNERWVLYCFTIFQVFFLHNSEQIKFVSSYDPILNELEITMHNTCIVAAIAQTVGADTTQIFYTIEILHFQKQQKYNQ